VASVLVRNIETQRTRVDLEQLRRYHDHGVIVIVIVIVIVLHSKYCEQENCDARGLRLLVLPCPPLASGCYRIDLTHSIMLSYSYSYTQDSAEAGL
jgi:hypothetical protein